MRCKVHPRKSEFGRKTNFGPFLGETLDRQLPAGRSSGELAGRKHTVSSGLHSFPGKSVSTVLGTGKKA